MAYDDSDHDFADDEYEDSESYEFDDFSNAEYEPEDLLSDEEYEHQRWKKQSLKEQQDLKKLHTCPRCFGSGSVGVGINNIYTCL